MADEPSVHPAPREPRARRAKQRTAARKPTEETPRKAARKRSPKTAATGSPSRPDALPAHDPLAIEAAAPAPAVHAEEARALDPPARHSADDADGEAMPADGRVARTVRTRTVIVDALLGLLEEGDLQPPANRIAERAGISLRLIYHHFGDLESLFRAAANREAERLAALVQPIDRSLPLAGRIAAMAEQRATLLEWITPVRRAALLQEPFSPELRAARQAFAARGEQEVRKVFAPELAALDEQRRETFVAALSGALAWGHWNDLRSSGRSVDEAKAAVHLCLTSLLRT